MGNSYVEEYLQSLWCQGNGEPFRPETEEAFVPNCFTGMNLNVQAYCPVIAPGAADFSYEFWFRWNLDQKITSDFFTVMGLCRLSGDFLEEGAMVSFSDPYLMSTEFRWDVLAGPAISSPWTTTGEPWNHWWNHVACNFDRSGNMTAYVNSNLIAAFTVDISAGVGLTMGAGRRFAPITCQVAQDLTDDPNAVGVDHPTDDWGNFTQHSAINGPVAYHNRLMTQAEVTDSWLRRYVQNIAGVTQVLWDWREPAGMTGYDFTFANMTSATKMGTIGTMMFGLPEGVAAAVTVPDLSGNGNDLTLPSATSYGTTQGPLVAGRRSWCALLSDPFWR